MDNFDIRKIVEVVVDVDKVNAMTKDIEDMGDIDPNYPTTDELGYMDRFLSNYTGFVDKINGRLSTGDTIALYAVYISTTRD